ncbi:MAG: RIP metalloprotease RseP [Spirochaetes bacterium]|nr:RIP metalloprotease RseP [Spirochaetota bacterium]
MHAILENVIIFGYGLFGLGIIIFAHELGHFLLAKRVGVHVETFSIGYGKGFLKFKGKETVYQIAYFPFGGYCKMAGEEPDEKHKPAPNEFYSKSPLARLSVVLGGPFMNYILGLVIFTIIMFTGSKQITYTNKIMVLDKLEMDNTPITLPAKKAGLQDEDIILKIDGKEVNHWNDLRKEIVTAGDVNFKTLAVKRKGEIINIKIKPIILPQTGQSLIGILPYIGNTIVAVQSNSVAFHAGIRSNDRIVNIQNHKINNLRDLKNILKKQGGKRVLVTILRRGNLINYHVKLSNINGDGFLGVELKADQIEYVKKETNLFSGLYEGFLRSNRVFKDVFYSLRTVVSGRVIKRKALSGPLRIAYVTGEAIQKGGLGSFFYLIGFISIAIGFFNLLPIPAVDGSYILIFLAEWLTGKKISFKVIKSVQRVGLILISILFIVIIFNDVRNLLERETMIANPFLPILI